MDVTGLGSIFDFGSKLIERIWPDPAQRAQASLELAKLQQSGELQKLANETQLLQGQIDINKVEAASSSKFISWWRPGAGWVGVISLALVYWPRAIVLCAVWCLQAYAALKAGSPIPAYPDLGVTDVLGLLGTLLGIGTLRTYEKRTGTEGNR